MIAFRGVRSSWLMLAMNRDLAWAACSAITVLSVRAAVSTWRIRTRIQAQPPATAAISSSEMTASAFSSGSLSPMMSWEAILPLPLQSQIDGQSGKTRKLDAGGPGRNDARAVEVEVPREAGEKRGIEIQKIDQRRKRLCPFGTAFKSRGSDGRDAEKNRAPAQLDESAARAVTVPAFSASTPCVSVVRKCSSCGVRLLEARPGREIQILKGAGLCQHGRTGNAGQVLLIGTQMRVGPFGVQGLFGAEKQFVPIGVIAIALDDRRGGEKNCGPGDALFGFELGGVGLMRRRPQDRIADVKAGAENCGDRYGKTQYGGAACKGALAPGEHVADPTCPRAHGAQFTGNILTRRIHPNASSLNKDSRAAPGESMPRFARETW